MSKNILKSLVTSLTIILISVLIFDFLGFKKDSIAIVMTFITIFSMFFCTYMIIDEMKNIK